MKRTILAGVALVTLGAASLMAQKPKSKAEVDAINAMINAAQKGDNDATIAAADELQTKFKDTEFKATALFLEARAYHAKGDDDRAQIYAEQCMAARPQRIPGAVVSGRNHRAAYPRKRPGQRREAGQSRERSQRRYRDTKVAAKPNPNVPDAQWEELKKQNIAEAQADLGRVFMLRKKFADAIAPLQAASKGDPQPAYFVWLAPAQQQAGKNHDAIATYDKLLARPALDRATVEAITPVKADAFGPRALSSRSPLQTDWYARNQNRLPVRPPGVAAARAHAQFAG